MEMFPIPIQDIKRTADQCVKCNICTSACPVVRVSDEFPGPKYTGPQAQRFRDPRSPSPDRSLDYCSGCGVCSLVCPHGVKVMEINTTAKAALRARQRQENPLNPFLFRNWVLGRNEMLGKLGSPVAPLANTIMGTDGVRWIMERTLGIDHRAPFPKFSQVTFRHWFYGRQKGAAKSPEDTLKRPVVYFHGCATNYYEPEVGKAVVALLEHNGFQVLVPEQNCCGLPMQSNGDFAGARALALANIRKLSPYAMQGLPIIVSGASCGLTLKSDYIELQGIRTNEARALAQQTYDISEFLWLEHQAGRLKTDFVRLLNYLPYHAACHQKLQGIGQPALDLLNLVPALRVEEMGADCCGIAGTYGYKHEKYDISHAVGKPLFQRIMASGARLAVCDNETCRWNIQANTHVRTVHTVQMLAQAYGLPGLESIF